MIYTVTWNQTGDAYIGRFHSSYFPTLLAKDYVGRIIEFRRLLAEMIIKSKDDSFTFIIQGTQMMEFNAWLDKYDLRPYIMYEMPYGVTNPVHPDRKRNLKLFVLQSKDHFQKELVK